MYENMKLTAMTEFKQFFVSVVVICSSKAKGYYRNASVSESSRQEELGLLKARPKLAQTAVGFEIE